MAHSMLTIALVSCLLAGVLSNRYVLRNSLNSLQDSRDRSDVTKGCDQRPADIVFVLDASNSIWPPHFKLQLEFVNKVIDIFDTSLNMTHVGLMIFSDKPSIQFDLGRYKGDAENMKNHVMRTQQQLGGTKTYLALDELRRHMLAKPNIRSWVTQLAIVITDGESDDPKRTAEEAALLHEQGIHVIAIGVGLKILRSELEAIASSPDDVFMVDSYDVLERLKDTLAWKACQVATLPPPTIKPLPQLIANCDNHNPIDILFSLPDDAGIIDMDLSLSFIKNVITDFTLGPTGVQVGITPRFCEQGHEILLQEYDNKVAFGDALGFRRLDSIATHLQIEYMYGSGFKSTSGARKNATPCAILIVDNQSEDLQETLRQADQARMAGIQLMVIGVGEYVGDSELGQIAGNENNWWHVPNFESLGSLKEQLTTRICQVMEMTE